MSSGSCSYRTRGGTPRFELCVASQAGQSAASCDFRAIPASHKARRGFKLTFFDGALYSSGENLLAELKSWRVVHVERPLPPEACGRGGWGVAKAMRGGREKQCADGKSCERMVARPPIRKVDRLRAPPSAPRAAPHDPGGLGHRVGARAHHRQESIAMAAAGGERRYRTHGKAACKC